MLWGVYLSRMQRGGYKEAMEDLGNTGKQAVSMAVPNTSAQTFSSFMRNSDAVVFSRACMGPAWALQREPKRRIRH